MTIEASAQRILGRSFFSAAKGAKNLTYTTFGNVSTTVLYRELSREQREVTEDDGLYRYRELTVAIKSFGADGVVRPDVQDTVTIEAENWAIESIQSDGIAAHHLHLLRREIIKKTRR